MSTPGTTTAGPATGLTFPLPPAIAPERTLSPGQWGILSFLVSEVALFSTLIVTYVFYLGSDARGGPTPAVLSLSLVLFTTACLLSSSVTIHFAEKTLERGNQGGFILLWAATIGLGAVFLLGTAYEWHGLISEHHLTISRNLFGTTYYTLVGLHALHVTGGVTIMLVVLGLALRRQVTTANRAAVGMVSWYWHFVDAVWVVVFMVVYVVGRSI
ncbi:MAG TPA: cytochrome c oxidase subunit 3 [Gemmataceae bacterium]|nr:cytochrome c oxidase subunit 3 [Gemmataceae bacterium]